MMIEFELCVGMWDAGRGPRTPHYATILSRFFRGGKDSHLGRENTRSKSALRSVSAIAPIATAIDFILYAVHIFTIRSIVHGVKKLEGSIGTTAWLIGAQ